MNPIEKFGSQSAHPCQHDINSENIQPMLKTEHTAQS